MRTRTPHARNMLLLLLLLLPLLQHCPQLAQNKSEGLCDLTAPSGHAPHQGFPRYSIAPEFLNLPAVDFPVCA